MRLTGPLDADTFAARLDPLGPFEACPTLAVAVSGGADSMALAWLASGWAVARGGRVLALVVDHGLRQESSPEAEQTVGRLQARGIAARGLMVADLTRGPRLAERARAARHAVLEQHCAQAGILHLLFGHHAGDQAETVAMRRLRGSGPAGLAGMAALVETRHVRKLRPLLDVPPVRLRQILLAAGLAWVEDPSNADPASERARLRALRRDTDGDGALTRAAVEATARRADDRTVSEAATAAWLGQHVTLLPSGEAFVQGPDIPAAALAALVLAMGGRVYAPPPAQIAGWLARPRAATLGGVQISVHRDGWRVRPEAARPTPATKLYRPLTPPIFQGAAWGCRIAGHALSWSIVAPHGGGPGDRSGGAHNIGRDIGQG